MKINLILTSNSKDFATKADFDEFSGKAAGVCYMPGSFTDLKQEDFNKTQRRIQQTKGSGHHSVYDHEFISLYLEDIPKALAMVLNNEKMYTTSEKSARYTKMILKENEQKLFDKWCNIYEKEIREIYNNKSPNFFTESRIKKLAQENARYLTSVFTPTSMIYTCSYRQLNIIYSLMKNEIKNDKSNKFYALLKPSMQIFIDTIKNSVPFLDEQLQSNDKSRELSFISPNKFQIEEYFGDVYATSYKATFAELAQAQRHRTLDYSVNLLETNEFFVPPIIKDKEDLKSEWINDCNSLSSNLPQGTLININERGTIDNFILKLKERKCSFAQLEINNQDNATLKKYYEALKQKNHPQASKMETYTHGSRCTFKDFTCKSPCGFSEGINETRKI